MITLKVLNPCVFNDEVRSDLCIVYASNEDGIRYNIKKTNNEGKMPYQSCASALCIFPLENEWEATDEITVNPQPLQQ